MSDREEREREADPSDRATQRELEITADALSEVRRAAVLPDIGCCHNCGELTGVGRRFCDSDCRDDFERREKLKVKYANAN